MSETVVCRRQILTYEDGLRAESRPIGIQMNQKELTKTFVMISNWEKPFGLHGLYKMIQRFKGKCHGYLSGMTTGPR